MTTRPNARTRIIRLLAVLAVLIAGAIWIAGRMRHTRFENERLLRAVRGCRAEDALNAIGEGADPNLCLDKRKPMPGILGVIQRLIPRSRREVCEETLVKAAVNDCLDAEPVVRALLAHGASSNTAGNGETPLERAIQVGHGSVARMLLDHGADPNPLGENEPLLAALNQRDSETVQALIRHHVNVNAGPPGSPVLGEVDSADSNDFRLILGAGADVNQPGIVALNAAKGNVPFLQLLAEHGASLDVRWEGSTPLYASAYAGQIESVRFLLSHERDSAHRQADATDTLNRLRNSGWRNLSLLPSSAKDTVIRALQQATH